MRVFVEKQWFNQWWLHLLTTIPCFGFLIYVCFKWFLHEHSVDKVGPYDYDSQILVIVLLVATLLLIFMFKLYIEIDEKGIQYKFFPFHRTMKLITWNEIENCQTRTYRPISEYGGWGYKIGMGGTAFNVKGNQGIQIKLKNGKNILLGTQKPKEAQLVINKYFNNEGI